MSVDKAALKEVLDLAKDADRLTSDKEVKPADPIGPKDKLKDLPEYLRPKDRFLKHAQHVCGFKFVKSNYPNGTDRYVFISKLVSSEKDLRRLEQSDEDRERDTVDGYDYGKNALIGSWNDPGIYALNYREMVAQLLEDHVPDHPECTRVLINNDSPWDPPELLVYKQDVYTGTDVSVARGLVLALKKLRVTQHSVRDYLLGCRNLGIYESYGGYFGYRKGVTHPMDSAALSKKRILKGQMPMELVMNLLYSMTNVLRGLMNNHGMHLTCSMSQGCRHFKDYHARIVLVYPLYVKIISHKERVLFHEYLKEAASYIRGLRKNTLKGRKEMADWLAKTVKKEKIKW
jgi:hypothetical protein